MSWLRSRILDPNEDAPQWRAALLRARIPERYWSAVPEQVKGDNQWTIEATARPDIWASKGWGFYLHGPFNTGKSAAAAILAMELIRRCHSVLWIGVREVPAIRFRDSELTRALDDRLATSDLLVMDDLGSERFKLDGPAGTALEETVRILYEHQRPVIFTSNRPWERFAADYSAVPAFVSVVTRLSIPIWLAHPWPGAPGVTPQ